MDRSELMFSCYLSVSPHIRTDQGKTTDNDEESTARHMQCKFVLESCRSLNLQINLNRAAAKAMQELMFCCVTVLPLLRNKFDLAQKHDCVGPSPRVDQPKNNNLEQGIIKILFTSAKS